MAEKKKAKETKNPVKKVKKKKNNAVKKKGVEIHVLKDVPTECVFYMVDGKALKNLKELAEALDMMEDEVFRHHVTDFNNDFSNWVGDLLLKSSFQRARALLNLKTLIY